MEKHIISQGFIKEVKRIINNSRYSAVRAMDWERVQMYWNIGKQIFVEEQNGKDRAEYGAYITKHLSAELTTEFGSGFSVRQIERCRQFYVVFPIASTLRTQLNWSQYKLLMSISDQDKQTYYIDKQTNTFID